MNIFFFWIKQPWRSLVKTRWKSWLQITKITNELVIIQLVKKEMFSISWDSYPYPPQEQSFLKLKVSRILCMNLIRST